MKYFREAKAIFDASHQHPVNQALHHLSNTLAIVAIVLLFYDWRWTIVCLALTQVFAIGGHIVFEKNKPAFAQYPNGIMVVASMTWSFERWFGLRQILAYFSQKSVNS